jgi:deoxyribonuclease-4
MPLLGAHMSISGGLDRALFRGKIAGCQVIQIFARNTTRWTSRTLSTTDIDVFHRAQEETSIEPVAIHDSYLINPASPRSDVREKSFYALLDEIEKAEILRIPYLVMHPGSHLGDGEKKGLERISESLNRIHEETAGFKVEILLETTAGQGTNLGYCFEHLAKIVEGIDARERVGYDFRTAVAYRDLMRRFDNIIGLNRLKLFHINDSKKGLGSRVDRHEHLGYGMIGKEAFPFFLKDPMFKDLPFLIETPKGKNKNGVDWDELNLKFLKHLTEE